MEKKNFSLVSVDIPTGFGTSLSLHPDATVTFHDLKEGMNRENCGEIEVVDIGIPEEAKVYVGPGELKVYYPRNKSGSHKGDNGVVLVVGGGPYVGAPVLSALAALRTGVDLVYLATPKRVAEAVYSLNANEGVSRKHALLLLNIIVEELSEKDRFVTEDLNLLSGLLDKVDAVVVGPGLGKHDETKEAVKKLLSLCREKNVSCVIDADAIGVVGSNREILKDLEAVVTPHRGEFIRLTGEKVPDDTEDAEKIVKEWAKKLGVTIVLKSSEDIISDGVRVKRNMVHHPAMTVGGTGDVLAGVVGGLLSKKVSPFFTGCIGTFLNGSAGLKAFEKKSYGVVATDVVEKIPLDFKPSSDVFVFKKDEVEQVKVVEQRNIDFLLSQLLETGDSEQVFSEIERIMEEKQVIREVAVLFFAHKKGFDVSEYVEDVFRLVRSEALKVE